YGLQPALVLQLAGRVAEEGYARVLGRHAAAVVRHADELPTAAAQLHRDVPRPGVDRVFKQLLHHGGGPFHNLAGGDEVRHEGGEYVNHVQWVHLRSALLLFGILYSKSVELSTAK